MGRFCTVSGNRLCTHCKGGPVLPPLPRPSAGWKTETMWTQEIPSWEAGSSGVGRRQSTQIGEEQLPWGREQTPTPRATTLKPATACPRVPGTQAIRALTINPLLSWPDLDFYPPNDSPKAHLLCGHDARLAGRGRGVLGSSRAVKPAWDKGERAPGEGRGLRPPTGLGGDDPPPDDRDT